MLLALPFILVGLIFFLVGFNALQTRQGLEKVGVRTTGTVVGIDRVLVPSFGVRRGGGYADAPIVRFTDETGTARELTPKVHTNFTPLKIGDEVAIIYDPHDPTKGELVSRSADNMISFGFMGVSLIPLGIAAFLLYAVKRVKKTA